MIKNKPAKRIRDNLDFTINFFDNWEPELEDALQSLPEEDILPHELFRLLMERPGPMQKKLVLITEQSIPVALAGISNANGYWAPITHYIIPGALFPIKEEYIAHVIPALEVEIKIGWWRMERPPPKIRWMRNLLSGPTYAIKCSQNFEDYWRKTKVLEYVAQSREKCRNFTFEINLPGTIEWLIKKWGAKWLRKDMPERPDLANRLLAARYLQKRGLFYTLALLDRDKITCTIGCLIHRNDAVFHQ